MRKKNLKLLLIIGVSLLLRLVHLDQSFWLDEAAQVLESSRPLLQQFNLGADFHPPLYHLFLHFWLQMDKSEVWVRLLSVLFGIGSIILIYLIGKHLFKEKQALLAAFFLAISPYHLWYSQETRPYIAFVFFSLASTFFLLKNKWIWYLVALTLSLYTNYFTFFLLFGHIVYLILSDRKYLKIGLISISFAILLFALWIPQFYKQLATGTNGLFAGWTDVVSFSPVKAGALTFAKFIFGRGTFANKYLYGSIIFPVFLLFIASLIKVWRSKTGKVLLLFFIVPFITAEIVSVFIPIIAPQRLLFLLPIFLLILVCGIYRLPRKIQFISITVVILTSLGGTMQYYIDPNMQREQWREAVSFTEQNADLYSVALFVFPDPFAPYLWYQKSGMDAWGIAPKFIVSNEDLEKLTARLENKKTVYLYQYLTGLTDPKQKTQRYLSLNGYIQKDTHNFPGVGFIYTYVKK